MKKWLIRTEHVVDRIIPLVLLILLVILILEFFFSEAIINYHTYVEVIDYFIILIFVVDLGFKYNKIRNIPLFVKKYWLEIIATIPFFLVFRFFEGLARLFGLVEETAREGQKALHAGVEISREFSKVGLEAEEVAKLSRSERFIRFLRPIARSPRLLKFMGEEFPKSNQFLHFFDEPEVKNYKKVENKIDFKPVKFEKEMFNFKRL